MMREVLTRRFAKLVNGEGAMTSAEPAALAAWTPSELDARISPLETPGGGEEAAFPARPDLILIDGGRGQFEAAQGVLTGMDIGGVAVAAIAKGPDRHAGRETIFMAGREPFRLSARDPALYFVQRLRDEAHRFAIGAHRARRKRGFASSPLDEIPGIGPARKRALLHAFGTAKAVSRAALADFEKVPGINAATARVIYDFFHDRGRH